MGERSTLSQRQEQQASRMRVADLRIAITDGIGTVLDKHTGQLTHEEICAALNEVMARHLGYLLAPGLRDDTND